MELPRLRSRNRKHEWREESMGTVTRASESVVTNTSAWQQPAALWSQTLAPSACNSSAQDLPVPGGWAWCTRHSAAGASRRWHSQGNASLDWGCWGTSVNLQFWPTIDPKEAKFPQGQSNGYHGVYPLPSLFLCLQSCPDGSSGPMYKSNSHPSLTSPLLFIPKGTTGLSFTEAKTKSLWEKLSKPKNSSLTLNTTNGQADNCHYGWH